MFQSCFEIIEQIFVKADGSGNFQLMVNLSKSKTKLNSIMKMKTVNGHDVPSKSEIENKIAAIEKAVSKTVGISNVKTNIDFDNYIATISCNFTKVNQLNTVIKNIHEKENIAGKAPEKTYNYDATTKSFTRLYPFSLKNEYNKMSNADKEIFSTANYTAIYKFEETVTTTSNKEAKVSPSKKAVMLKLNALDIITDKKSIENKITLTK
jgi:hypothetical protein